MKAGLITVILLALVGSLSGCGQKGPLYREAAPDISNAEASASDGKERPDQDADKR